MATDIDIKAQALSAARARILALQEQMTERVLQMAAEVEKLMEVVPAREAKAFLKVRCNLPAVELSTYIGFAKTLKGSGDVLRTGRVSFPVVKTLVSADAETREDVLARIAAGAQIDTKDVSAIKKQLRDSKLTIAEILAARNRKAIDAAARKRAKASVASFEQKMSSFVDDLRAIYHKRLPESAVVRDGLQREAGELLLEFESIFGADHPAPPVPSSNTAGHQVTAAWHALRKVKDGRFGSGQIFGLQDDDHGPRMISALQALTDRASPVPGLRRRTGLTTLPPARYRLKALELCAGAGGMALGLERAGFRHVALIEYDKNAAATLRKNRPNWNVVEADVREIDFTRYRNEGIDLLAGGIPCTPYSTVGNRKGKKDENDLLMEGVRAVKQAHPKAFIFENVEGLLHSSHADHVGDALRKLTRAGYETAIHRINARDYGIAQDRSRILIVGVRKEFAGAFRMPPKFPEMASNIGDALAYLIGANGWTGAADWVRTMREQPFHDRFGNPVQIGALSATMRGRQGVGREKEDARWKRNGFTYAPIPKSAPTNEEAAKAGFVPGLTLPCGRGCRTSRTSGNSLAASKAWLSRSGTRFLCALRKRSDCRCSRRSGGWSSIGTR